MATYKPSKDEGCCSISFLKYLLFIFNFVFMLAGGAVLGVGIWTLISKADYISLLTTSTYAVVTYMLIVAGSIAIIVGFIGCFGLWKEDHCTILFYTFALLLIFLLEVVAGVLAYIYQDQVMHELKNNLNATFLENYYYDKDMTTAIDNMQRGYKCCGAFTSDDWKHCKGLREMPDKIMAPNSCCITESVGCAKNTHPSNIHEIGCADSFAHHLQDHLIILGAVGLGISSVQIFGMIFSCCLYVKLKDYDDY